MKFTIILFAALAVASAVESDPAKAEESTDLLERLSKWFPFRLPSINLAPIRTTPRPARVTARPPPKAPTPRPRPVPTTRAPAPRPTTAAPEPESTTAAPEPEVTTSAPEPEVTTIAEPEITTGAAPASDEEATSQSSNSENSETVAEIMDAVNKASSMDDLKNALLQMKDFATPMTPEQQAMFNKPLGEFPVAVQSIIAKFVEYIQGLNGKAPNMNDPIEIELPTSVTSQ